MKLPGIQRGAVQSLGREDSSLGAKRHFAKAGLIYQVGETFGQAVETIDKVVMQPMWEAEALTELNRAEGAQKIRMTHHDDFLSRPMVSVSEMFGKAPWMKDKIKDEDLYVTDQSGKKTRVDMIPTHKIMKDYYSGAIVSSGDASMANIKSDRARRKYSATKETAYLEDYSKKLEQARAWELDYDRGNNNYAIQSALDTGDLETANIKIMQGKNAGFYTAEETAEMLTSARYEATSAKFSIGVQLANSTEALDVLETQLVQAKMGGTLKESHFSSHASAINAKRVKITTATVKTRDDASRDRRSLVLQQMSGMDTPFSQDQLAASVAGLQPIDRDAVIAANNSIKSTAYTRQEAKRKEIQSKNDALKVSSYEMYAMDLVKDYTLSQTAQQRMLEAELRRGLTSGDLTDADARSIRNGFNSNQKIRFSSPDFKYAENQLAIAFTGAGSDALLSGMDDNVDRVGYMMAKRRLYEIALYGGDVRAALEPGGELWGMIKQMESFQDNLEEWEGKGVRESAPVPEVTSETKREEIDQWEDDAMGEVDPQMDPDARAEVIEDIHAEGEKLRKQKAEADAARAPTRSSGGDIGEYTIDHSPGNPATITPVPRARNDSQRPLAPPPSSPAPVRQAPRQLPMPGTGVQPRVPQAQTPRQATPQVGPVVAPSAPAATVKRGPAPAQAESQAPIPTEREFEPEWREKNGLPPDPEYPVPSNFPEPERTMADQEPAQPPLPSDNAQDIPSEPLERQEIEELDSYEQDWRKKHGLPPINQGAADRINDELNSATPTEKEWREKHGLPPDDYDTAPKPAPEGHKYEKEWRGKWGLPPNDDIPEATPSQARDYPSTKAEKKKTRPRRQSDGRVVSDRELQRQAERIQDKLDAEARRKGITPKRAERKRRIKEKAEQLREAIGNKWDAWRKKYGIGLERYPLDDTIPVDD